MRDSRDSEAIKWLYFENKRDDFYSDLASGSPARSIEFVSKIVSEGVRDFKKMRGIDLGGAMDTLLTGFNLDMYRNAVKRYMNQARQSSIYFLAAPSVSIDEACRLTFERIVTIRKILENLPSKSDAP